MFAYSLSTLKRGLEKSYHSFTYTPTDAIIFLTYRCTSRCVACNMWQRPVDIEDELSWEQWQPILENLAQSGIHNIEMFGGDALLRKDLLLQMIRFCTDHGIGTFFPTNSSALTEKTIEGLVDAGLGTLYISFDEVPDMGTSVRGVKRHFEKVAKSIEMVKKIRGARSTPRISCITTVSSMNYQHLETLNQAAFELGADEHMIRGISEFTPSMIAQTDVNGIHPDPYFMSTDGRTHAYTDVQADELLAIIDRIWHNRHKHLPMSTDITNLRGLAHENLTHLTYPHQTCVFATTQVVISPYGEVLPCLYFKDYVLGNLTEQNLAEVWGNGLHRQFCRQQQKQDMPLCDQCSIKFYHKTFIPSVKDVARAAVDKLGGIGQAH